jgi:hypothetical protein
VQTTRLDEGPGHIQHQYEPISPRGLSQYGSQLLPSQNLFILRPEIFGNLQRTGGIFTRNSCSIASSKMDLR